MCEKISVIIPIYNSEKTLKNCIDSVISQSYSNLEIICVDDGSADCSLQIINQYNDSRISIIAKEENGGVSEARNVGMQYASGEIISFLDSDDKIHPLYFEKLVEAMKKYSADVAVCRKCLVSNFNETAKVDKGSEHLLTEMERENDWDIKCVVWGRIYKRCVLHNIKFANLLHEDTVFNREVFIENPKIKIVLVESKLYYYLNTINNLSKKSNVEDRFLQHAKYWYEKYNSTLKDQYLKLSLDCALHYRYIVKDKDKLKNKDYKNFIKRIQKSIRTSNFSSISKSKYILAFNFPIIYTMFRAINDNR